MAIQISAMRKRTRSATEATIIWLIDTRLYFYDKIFLSFSWFSATKYGQIGSNYELDYWQPSVSITWTVWVYNTAEYDIYYSIIRCLWKKWAVNFMLLRLVRQAWAVINYNKPLGQQKASHISPSTLMSDDLMSCNKPKRRWREAVDREACNW